MQKKAPSKIEELGVRKLVEDLFASEGTNYARIIEIVKEQTGQAISDSSLSRSYQKWQRKKMCAEASEREVEALMRALSGNPDLDIKKSVLGVFWAKVAERFADANLTFDQADALDMSHLLLKAFRTEQAGGQLDLQKERIELMKQKVASVADEVSETVKAAGLSADTVAQIKERILGVAPAA